MRASKSGGGTVLYLLLAALISSLVAALLCVHYFNGTEPADELPESVETPVVAQVAQPIPETPETQEETLRREANKLLNCTVTYYCCELRPHICGTGDGLTASGAPVQAGVSCAVDPGLIPLGSTVWVDYGDGELHEYIAQDVGAWIVGGHIDLAVATHDEANLLGRRTATVYWKEG